MSTSEPPSRIARNVPDGPITGAAASRTAPPDGRSQEDLKVAFPRRRFLRPAMLLPYLDPLVLPTFQGTSGQVDDPEPQKQRDHEEAQHPRELPYLRRQKDPPPVKTTLCYRS